MPQPTDDRLHRWDHAPLEETLDGARRLTVSVTDRILRAGWEQLAVQVGIPPRRWRRFHPLADGPAVSLVDGRPAFDAAAWERFVSLVPGAVALPSRTAATFGIARRALVPPDRRVRLLDLIGARRRQRRMRRALRDLEAEHARFRATLDVDLAAVLTPGDDGTAWHRLPAYALASRFDGLLRASLDWTLPPVADLLAAEATRTLMQLLVDHGNPPGDALLLAASLQSGGGASIPAHVRDLERIAAIARPEQRASALDAWRDGLGGWHAMREQLLEATPLRELGDSVLSLATAEPSRAEGGPLPAEDPHLAAIVAEARALTARREELARDRAAFHAALRALAWTIGQRLVEAGALTAVDEAFDLSVDEFLGVARGATLPRPPSGPTTRSTVGAPPATGLVEGGSPTGRTELRGIPASPGSARGRVLVVSEPQPDLDVAGAVLFCRSTDPAWLPLLVRCAGLVTERGGPLSHAAIVARELRLPAVVAARGALEAAAGAQEALVDGTSGLVTLDH